MLIYSKQLGANTHEQAEVHLLDNNHLLIHTLHFANQSTHKVQLSARSIFEAAFGCKASQFILVHNHPSGKSFPSKHDHQTTEKLVLIGGLVQVRLLDHIIITKNDYFSFFEQGLLSGYERE